MKSSLLNFVLSEDFDEFVLKYVIEEKKRTLIDYINAREIRWDDNDVRFTVHDMNRAKVQYLDAMVEDILSKAKAMAWTLFTWDWSDKKYQQTHNLLTIKSDKLKYFL